ncbi:hypothetical protein N7504_001938 [Penicillium tannophilum]|nr:hypothetical protein N7504_001938 [Penicillium tannophilum]
MVGRKVEGEREEDGEVRRNEEGTRKMMQAGDYITDTGADDLSIWRWLSILGGERGRGGRYGNVL